MKFDFSQNRYPAEVVKIIDGDTVKLRLDAGFHIQLTENFRLARINTPEIRGPERPEGLKAKEFLATEMPIGSQVEITTMKSPGKYGRWIVEIWLGDVNINDLLVESGHAILVDF